MIFSSITFIYYFLPTFLIVYLISPKKYKNIVLLLFSLIFYFYGEPKYILLMLIEVLFAYFISLKLEKNKTLLIFSLIFHLSLLCYFKYFNFLISILNNVLNSNISFFNIVLPIGISFYTFQIISYEIDVYKGMPKEKNLINFMTYIFLFPQLIAGPIVRYQDIKNELINRNITLDNLSHGIKLFIIGLLKKIVIANNIGELANILATSSEASILLYWLLAISYMLQIYFDFSGYSDIAIGLGKMIGFNLPDNFNYPYTATSITDFFRKWHITLSSWFKDYVYIPLGGNRKCTFKTIRNLLIVWLLTGLWHGANYNFIIWGLYFGIILIIEKFILKKYFHNTNKIIKHIYTLFIVMISFIIFSSNDLTMALKIIKGLFNFNLPFKNAFVIYYLKSYLLILIGAIIFATPLIKNIINKLKEKKKLLYIINILEIIFIIISLIIITSMLIDSSYNPFLYFRF